MDELSNPRLNRLSTTPNMLTLARICLAPFLVVAILDARPRLALWLFLAAGLTDALDGALARLLRQRSVLGQYLDPVADKLLLSTLFLVLTHKTLIPTTVTVLVFGRDLGILVVAAILYAAEGRRDFRPSIYGKANTAIQVLAVSAVLLAQVFAPAWVLYSRSVLLNATVALTILSGLHYAWQARRLSTTSGHFPTAQK